jgi:hypothetical protein
MKYAAALLWQICLNCKPSQAAGAIANAKPLGPELGNGNLDKYEALVAITSLRYTCLLLYFFFGFVPLLDRRGRLEQVGRLESAK